MLTIHAKKLRYVCTQVIQIARGFIRIYLFIPYYKAFCLINLYASVHISQQIQQFFHFLLKIICQLCALSDGQVFATNLI